MKRSRVLLVLAMFVTGLSIPAFAETTDTIAASRPQPPQFASGQRSQMKGQNGPNGQFGGRRPTLKPDSQPGGKMEPKEWDSSSNGVQGGEPPQMNGQNGQPPQMNGQNGQLPQINANEQPPEPPQFDGNNSNGRPPMPPQQNNSTSTEN